MQKKYISIIVGISILSLFILFVTSPLSNEAKTAKFENGTMHFSIRNLDNITHTITVEILDSNNTSKFSKSYNVTPDERPEPILVSLKKDTYMYEITLDNNITKRQIAGKYPEDLSLEYLTIYIHPYPEDALELSFAIE